MHPLLLEASITIFLATSLAIYTLMHGHPGRARRLFIALIGSIVVWSAGVAMSRVLTDTVAANDAVRVSFVGIYALPPIWYALALHLTRRTHDVLSPGRLALLGVPSVLAFCVMATNSWHHLYMRDPLALVTKGPLDWAGPLFWVWSAWAYLLVFGASVRYARWSWHLVSNDAHLRGALVCAASILPLSGNFAHLAGWTAQDHDLTPLLLGVATMMLFVANRRFRMLDTLPVARRDVIEQLRDGVIVADAKGVILDMNPAAEHMIQASFADLVGKSIVHVVAAQSVNRFDFDEAEFNRTVVDMCNSARGFESVIEDFAGQHYEVRGAGVADAGGAVSGLYIIIRNVTQRNRYEEMQRESRRAQSIASLAAGIAHEMNNPLSYVRANVSHVIDELSDRSQDDGDDRSHDDGDKKDDDGKKDDLVHELKSVLSEALEGIDRISTIVERVRKFTHTRGSEREAISIESVFDEASRMFASRPGAAIDIETQVATDVGPVTGFRDGLLEAILNLLDNAQNALQETGGVIRLEAHRRGHSVRLEIEDDGPGVPEHLREQIFEPFFTTGKTSPGAGTGLGLTISGKLISDFGGFLSYEPVATGGARFVIELPEIRQ